MDNEDSLAAKGEKKAAAEEHCKGSEVTAKKSGAKFGPNKGFVTLFANPYLCRIV